MKKSTDIAAHCEYMNLPADLRALLNDGNWTFCLQVWERGIVLNFTRRDRDIVTVIGIVAGDEPMETWTVLTKSMHETLHPRPSIAEGTKEGTKGDTWREFIDEMEAARIAAIAGAGKAAA